MRSDRTEKYRVAERGRGRSENEEEKGKAETGKEGISQKDLLGRGSREPLNCILVQEGGLKRCAGAKGCEYCVAKGSVG